MRRMRHGWFGLCFCAGWLCAAQAQPVNPDFAQVAAKLDSGGTFYLYMDIEEALNNILLEIEPLILASGDPQAAMISPIARAIIGALGLNELDDLGISAAPLENGARRHKVYLHLKRRGGIFALAGGPPANLEGAGFLPPGALLARVDSLDASQLLPLADSVALAAAGAAGQQQLRQALQRLKGKSGVDLELLLNSLGREAGMYARLDNAKIATLPVSRDRSIQIPTPRFVFFVQTQNRQIYDTILALDAAGRKRLQPLATSLAGLDAAAVRIEDNPFGLTPVLAQSRRWLFFASDVDELKFALQTAESGNHLTTSPAWNALAQGFPREVNGLAFVSPSFAAEAKKLFEQLDGAGVFSLADEDFQNFLQVIRPRVRGLDGVRLGQAGVRINDPEGLYWIQQGDLGGAAALNSLMLAPALAGAAIAIPNFLEASVRSKISRARSDMRSIATAIECYYVDNNTYPAWTLEPGLSVNPAVPGAPPVPSFRRFTSQGSAFTLTTPIAYMTSLPQDSFQETEGATYGYYSIRGASGASWILFSPGPDGDFDLPWKQFQPGGGALLAPFTYDPTNGTVSDGDIWRSNQ